ncbi:hypothetical protein GCM10009854_17550 [Saccharopolyspora halophila]|uniref:Uncharacterized protein n=1 Tax=Saccharopolyspora halophila TaxID=405551 RepID=A0ABN3G0G8_9PSEU
MIPLARRRPRTNVEDLLVETAVNTALDSGDPAEAEAILELAEGLLTACTASEATREAQPNRATA